MLWLMKCVFELKVQNKDIYINNYREKRCTFAYFVAAALGYVICYQGRQ